MKTDLQISTGKYNDRGEHETVGIEGVSNPVQGWDVGELCHEDDTGT